MAVSSARSIGETITASLLIVLDLGAFMVWNSNINYVSDVMCRTRRTRPFPVPDPTYQPMVSIHIPAYNEPPEILLETIKSVEAQDYPNFEVIILDNNTHGSGDLGAGRGVLPRPAAIELLSCGPVDGFQGGRQQPRAAQAHPPRRRDHRDGRRGRHREAVLPERDRVPTSATSRSASSRPAKATATTRAAPTTPPASTPTRASTWR